MLAFLGSDPGSGRQPSLRPHVHKQTEKTTRVRTVLNEKQLHTLRTCYAANPRPDALMKEQLVEMTGLSPRVIRVWFQNKRCKDKKKSILMKQLQQQQHNDKTSLQGLTGTPLVAGSPIRHESAVQGSAVEVQTYQPPWKALSEFALQSDLDQPAFQQLVSFSESGSLGNSSGSDVTSLSSQLPDTPNSMVPSPVETNYCRCHSVNGLAPTVGLRWRNNENKDEKVSISGRTLRTFCWERRTGVVTTFIQSRCKRYWVGALEGPAGSRPLATLKTIKLMEELGKI
ncbi:ISL LIM homeobox 2 [Camelus ferus]|nr:ISL LIM homeobox 2 [Camelus ferus]